MLEKIEALANEPRPIGCKKLRGAKDLWRVRIGDYRIVYSPVGRMRRGINTIAATRSRYPPHARGRGINMIEAARQEPRPAYRVARHALRGTIRAPVEPSTITSVARMQ